MAICAGLGVMATRMTGWLFFDVLHHYEGAAFWLCAHSSWRHRHYSQHFRPHPLEVTLF